MKKDLSRYYLCEQIENLYGDVLSVNIKHLPQIQKPLKYILQILKQIYKNRSVNTLIII